MMSDLNASRHILTPAETTQAVIRVLGWASRAVANGWMQGGNGLGFTPRGRLNAVGAMEAIREGAIKAGNQSLEVPARRVLMARLGPSWQTVGEWNDAPDRTAAEVAQALQEAAEMAHEVPS
jgi:hypothetical protein